MKIFTLILSLFFLGTNILPAQQTVGLFLNTTEAFDGYTLFCPRLSTTTYLINNCGEKVHSWTNVEMNAASVYLMEDGKLYRRGTIEVTQGVYNQVLQVLDWDSNVLWTYSVTLGSEHHDIEILPNGNILFIVQDERTQAEIIEVGGTAINTKIFSERILEVQPDFVNGGGTIIWDWKVWDHLIQDTDPNKPNYGTIANSPERININATNSNTSNWLHFNSVSYNSSLDQICISVPKFNEFWIIDHSTTTAEAAGSTEGNSGKGGDLLYRWGNPRMYNQGTENNQKLFFQHHPHWIPEGYPGAGKILVFNNRAGEPIGAEYSTVNVIAPPIDANGSYSYTSGAYQPNDFDWSYIADTPVDFHSHIISGAQRLENGNTLICEGTSGRFFEINSDGNIVWEYISPVNSNGPVTQGDSISGSLVFRAIRYAPNYLGLANQDLTPQGYIETGSTFSCNLFPVSIKDIENGQTKIQVYPNIVTNELNINSSFDAFQIEIFNLSGQLYQNTTLTGTTNVLNVSSLGQGMYILKISDSENNYIESHKFVKQ